MKKEKIQEWHNMVVNGLVNGLSHTARDGRLDDIEFWRRRSNLFDSFAHCIMDLETDQDYSYSEKDLKQWSSSGYIKKESSQ